jgi:hypothetical protein
MKDSSLPSGQKHAFLTGRLRPFENTRIFSGGCPNFPASEYDWAFRAKRIAAKNMPIFAGFPPAAIAPLAWKWYT